MPLPAQHPHILLAINTAVKLPLLRLLSFPPPSSCSSLSSFIPSVSPLLSSSPPPSFLFFYFFFPSSFCHVVRLVLNLQSSCVSIPGIIGVDHFSCQLLNILHERAIMGPLNARTEFNARLRYSGNSCIQVQVQSLWDASLLH